MPVLILLNYISPRKYILNFAKNIGFRKPINKKSKRRTISVNKVFN